MTTQTAGHVRDLIATTDPPVGTPHHQRRVGAGSPAGGPQRWSWLHRMTGVVRAVGMASAVLLLGTGCQTQTAGIAPEQLTVQTPMVLAAGDVVKVSFPGASEFTQSQKIQMDGKINLPLIGEVAAAGKTLEKLQSDLTRLYASQLQNHSVVVTMEAGDIRVFVSGAVKSPGRITFDRPTTVLEALIGAGGINTVGNLKKVRLIRVVQGTHQTQVLDLRTALSGQTTPAFYVRSGDVIFVPENIF